MQTHTTHAGIWECSRGDEHDHRQSRVSACVCVVRARVRTGRRLAGRLELLLPEDGLVRGDKVGNRRKDLDRAGRGDERRIEKFPARTARANNMDE